MSSGVQRHGHGRGRSTPSASAVLRIVAIERLFAGTPRGLALINRIKADPALNGCEIRVMSHGGGYSSCARRTADRGGGIRTTRTVPRRSRPSIRAARAARSATGISRAAWKSWWMAIRHAGGSFERRRTGPVGDGLETESAGAHLARRRARHDAIQRARWRGQHSRFRRRPVPDTARASSSSTPTRGFSTGTASNTR